jgi:uncharacterized membrane protein YdbT with pleckstrin-like domain
MKDGATGLHEVDFQVKWEDKPAGLIQRLLTKINLNFTDYQITKDELIIKKGFIFRRVNAIELYLLKDPDLTMNIYQRLLGISTVSALIDTKSSSNTEGSRVYLKNIKNGDRVRKLLRDSIEADVMERQVTYFDKV